MAMFYDDIRDALSDQQTHYTILCGYVNNDDGRDRRTWMVSNNASRNQHRYCLKNQDRIETKRKMQQRRDIRSDELTTDEELRQIYRKISRAIRRDLRTYNQAQIKHTMENNKSMKMHDVKKGGSSDDQEPTRDPGKDLPRDGRAISKESPQTACEALKIEESAEDHLELGGKMWKKQWRQEGYKMEIGQTEKNGS
ncbi:hypothetical protein HUJ05_008796 [Dendroctonus ponderosae]|nr:hypothetical protein HUJ05_008796 [Dendroctonus ponderosae]